MGAGLHIRLSKEGVCLRGTAHTNDGEEVGEIEVVALQYLL